jgi:hypothetical protein
MKKFVTMLALPITEQLGSQMWHFAALSHIARRSGHRVVFFEEHCHTGKGLKLDQHFRDLPMERVSVAALPEAERTYTLYPVSKAVAVDSGVFKLDPAMSYDFQGLFSSYKYWWPGREAVRRMYRFDPDVVARARAVVDPVRASGREVVSLHVRRTDYINGLFVNVNRDYFDAAFRQFDDRRVTYLVFSDDMAWCREAFADKDNIVFADNNEAIVDMCAMSLCDHNITANSSFSFWGAFLNESPGKKMIGPARTLKSDAMIPHLNYCWLPDDFILIDEGNV